MPDPRSYVCDCCKRSCISDWSEEEAVAEARAMYGDEVADNIEETCGVLCDDCYREYLIWLKGRT